MCTGMVAHDRCSVGALAFSVLFFLALARFFAGDMIAP
jgi:hypothetical protein